MADSLPYPGTELELFAQAKNWKRYLRAELEPFLGRDVLEVGSGIGGTTKLLCRGSEQRWVCLEPDATLIARLTQDVQNGQLPGCCIPHRGTIVEISEEPRFDTILYVDVLEHIEDDCTELAAAARRLAPGGHLAVLAPAHPWLFTRFDAAVGHFRRYTRRSLAHLSPPGLELVRLRSLDSVGLLASAGNRLLLRQAMPTERQISIWDGYMVPCSRIADRFVRHRVGKSVLAIWRRIDASRET